MLDLFDRVATWIVRRLFPPAGRHRQPPALNDALVARNAPSPACFTSPAAPSVPRWSIFRAEETAAVRPYVLAAERHCGRTRGFAVLP